MSGTVPPDAPRAGTPVPPEVVAVWRHREQIEREAAAMFGALADAVAGSAPSLAVRLRAASDDETRHALACRAIVDAGDGGARPALAPRGGREPRLDGGHRVAASRPRTIVLGPASLPAERRALYTSVALGCITESYACALLLAMRQVVTYAPVVAAVASILPDEIEHSRLGWAHLALAHARGDVGWLRPHVEAMRAAAIDHEVRATPTARGLGAYGILEAAEVDAIADETWRTVIAPGLARYGVA